jgi:hypothetical protein
MQIVFDSVEIAWENERLFLLRSNDFQFILMEYYKQQIETLSCQSQVAMFTTFGIPRVVKLCSVCP